MRKFTSTEWNDAADLLEQLFYLLGRDGHEKSIDGPKEVERKWLVNPGILNVLRIDKDVKSYRERQINSVWLSVDPEVRVRAYYDEFHRDQCYKVCYKGKPEKGGLVRTEIECECTPDVYRQAIQVASKFATPFMGSIVVPMKFWIIETLGITYEIKSIDFGMEYQLEIETANEEDAMRIKLPKKVQQCIFKEVTDDPRHKLCGYWQRTRKTPF